MRLLINAVGLRAGGGLTVGLNCLRGIRQLRPDYDVLALVPAREGYEELCVSLDIPYRAFACRPGYAAWRVWFDQVLMFHNPFYIYPIAEWWPLVSPFDRASLLLQRGLFALSARRCARVIAQTSVAAKRLHQQYGIDAGKLSTVPNAVAREHDQAESEAGARLAARMHGAAAGRVSVLTLSRYYPHKDLEFVVRVARTLRETGDRRFVFFITIAPDQHPGAQALLDTIAREGLQDEVVNLGPVGFGELRSVYGASRICFLASVLESMSGAYLEDFARAACGAGGRYFAPGNVEAAIEQLRRAAASGCSQVASGAHLAAPRPWADVCRDLVAILDSVRHQQPWCAAHRRPNDLSDCRP